MTKRLVLLLLCATLSAFAQTSSTKYQSGTIMAVTAHQDTPQDKASGTPRYDVSVKVGNTLYVVLYTPPNGTTTVTYVAGRDLPVLVGAETITFYSDLSGKTEVPILRRESITAPAKIDWTKAPGQYFSMKMQHLSEALNLTEDQQTKIRPILEQEVGEAGQYWGNPVLSQKEKLAAYEKIVRSSDAKLKPLLTPAQVEKLEAMRKQQKQELKKLIADRDTDRQN
ncbi:MAG TPA: hypothetical protein VEG30_04005 [Terriglobales bacterium]|nr:hypothetical protein [Terriglobales bacterium]